MSFQSCCNLIIISPRQLENYCGEFLILAKTTSTRQNNCKQNFEEPPFIVCAKKSIRRAGFHKKKKLFIFFPNKLQLLLLWEF